MHGRMLSQQFPPPYQVRKNKYNSSLKPNQTKKWKEQLPTDDESMNKNFKIFKPKNAVT